MCPERAEAELRDLDAGASESAVFHGYELLRRLDRVEDARVAYDRALKLVHSDAERRFLERRLAELQG